MQRTHASTSAHRAEHDVPLDIATMAAEQTADAIDRLGFTADHNTALWQMNAAAGVIRTLLLALAAGDEDEVRIPGQRPPSPHSHHATAEDRPELPRRRVPHEDDGRQDTPEPARPHPSQVVAA